MRAQRKEIVGKVSGAPEFWNVSVSYPIKDECRLCPKRELVKHWYDLLPGVSIFV